MHFVVIRERGAAWNSSREMHEQEEWAKHAAFMNDLVSAGFIIFGGPLGDGSRILLVVDAEGDEAIRESFEADPWTRMQLLSIVAVDRWQILLGDLGKR